MLCQSTGVDVTCGASMGLSRTLGQPGALDAALCRQEPVLEDSHLASMPDAELFDVDKTPPCIEKLVCREEHATCGFIYTRGRLQLWANDRCVEDYFSAEEANDRFRQMGVLPCFLFGRCVDVDGVSQSVSHPVHPPQPAS